MSSDPIEVLRSLPEKWRGLANDAMRRSGTWSGSDMADRIEYMADELESALASLSAPKPSSVNDNAVAVNEVAPVNDKPESAGACPECKGKGWTPEAGVVFDDPVICPDCAGSGRAEHSITANESASPRPEASAPVGVEEAFEEYHKADHRDPAVAQEWEWWQASWKASLAQQPAAVDEATCVAVYDAVSRANLTREIKTEARKAAIVRAALAGQQQENGNG